MAVHSIQNRTGEFQAILATAKRRQASAKGVSASSQRRSLLTDEQKKAAGHGGGASNGSANGGGDDAPRRSEFARRAAEIGRGIGATMAKLERLAQLAKKKTMFDDNPVQVNELTFVVKQDLSSLNQQIGALQALTRQEHPGARAGADQEGEHNRNVLVLLQGRLSSVGADFKDILEVRTRNMAASRSRTEHFVSAVGQPAAAAAAAAATATGPGAGAAAAAAAALQHSASPLYGTPSRGTPSPGADLLSLQPSGDHQVLMMMEEAQPTNTYIQCVAPPLLRALVPHTPARQTDRQTARLTPPPDSAARPSRPSSRPSPSSAPSSPSWPPWSRVRTRPPLPPERPAADAPRRTVRHDRTYRRQHRGHCRQRVRRAVRIPWCSPAREARAAC